MANDIRINYIVDDTQIQATEKSLDKLNKTTDDAIDESKELENATSDLSDQLKNTANNVQIMGVGLGDAAGKLGGVTKATNLWGRALKALPIVAIVAAIGSLVTFLTKTERGQQRLNAETAKLNAVMAVFRDRISAVGEGLLATADNSDSLLTKFVRLIKVTSGLQTGLQVLKQVFPELTAEIEREAEAAAKLSNISDRLTRAEIAFSVARAKANVEIEKQKFIAEDVTETLDTRIAAANRALDLERETLANEQKAAELRVRVLEQQQALGENTLEDRRELAEAEIRLAQIQQTSATKLIELNNKLNILEKERQAQFEAQTPLIEDRVARTVELAEVEIDLDNRKTDLALKNIEKRKKAEEDLAMITLESLGIVAGAFANIVNEQSRTGKTLALFEVQLATATAVAKGIASAQSVPFPGNLLAIATTTAAVLNGVAQSRQIINASQPPEVRVQEFAEGVINLQGGVRGKDSIPSMLMPGESVMTTRETSDFLPTLTAIRKGDVTPEELNNVSSGMASVVEVPRDRFSWDEKGFTSYMSRKSQRIERKIQKYSN